MKIFISTLSHIYLFFIHFQAGNKTRVTQLIFKEDYYVNHLC